MYTEVLRSIAGIEVFPVVSLVLFVTFFSGMIVWAVRLRSDRLVELAEMPLDPTPGESPRRAHPPTFRGEARDPEAR